MVGIWLCRSRRDNCRKLSQICAVRGMQAKYFIASLCKCEWLSPMKRRSAGGGKAAEDGSAAHIYAWVYGQVDRPTIRYAGRRKTALKLRQDLPEFDNCGNADNLFLTARPLDLRPFPPLNPREPAPNCWPGQKDSGGLVLFLSRALSSIDNWIKSLGAKKISR